MHQAILAMAAVVLDEEGTTQEMIDYDFQTGKLDMIIGAEYPYGRKYILTGSNILTTLVDDVDRGGFGNESAPGDNNLWLNQKKVVTDVFDGYDRYADVDLYENVKFKKMFQAGYPPLNYIAKQADNPVLSRVVCSFQCSSLAVFYMSCFSVITIVQ